MSEVIYGAGLAGLMAANAFQNAHIFEAGPEGSTNHKALLRFRSSAVGDALGIEFRKVRVHKGIWDDGFQQPDVQSANLYSQKVIGKVGDRSIWNIEPVDRYVAPENLLEQLLDRVKNRISYNSPIGEQELAAEVYAGNKIISTMPLGRICDIVNKIKSPIYGSDYMTLKNQTFKSAPIMVTRYRIKDCDVFQTIYFPSPLYSTYRASITKDLLIIEEVIDEQGGTKPMLPIQIAEAFGILNCEFEFLEDTKQSFGKIAPIDEAWRKATQFRLTHEFGIYSLGRFGTWRNILLDDVLKDLTVIKKLMAASPYELNRHNAK
jgi:hypothetical protein